MVRFVNNTTVDNHSFDNNIEHSIQTIIAHDKNVNMAIKMQRTPIKIRSGSVINTTNTRDYCRLRTAFVLIDDFVVIKILS